MKLNAKGYTLHASFGIAALPTLLIISGILIEIVVAIALVANILSTTGYGARFSREALVAAEAGVQDAALRIARDKEYGTLGGTTYSITVGNSSVQVTVYKDVGQGGVTASGKHRIVSTGTARVFSKKIEVVYDVDETTGKLILEAYNELTF